MLAGPCVYVYVLSSEHCNRIKIIFKKTYRTDGLQGFSRYLGGPVCPYLGHSISVHHFPNYF